MANTMKKEQSNEETSLLNVEIALFLVFAYSLTSVMIVSLLLLKKYILLASVWIVAA